jgi:hypothetical protein
MSQVVGSFCLRNANQLRKETKNNQVSAKSVEKWLFCGYFEETARKCWILAKLV